MENNKAVLSEMEERFFALEKCKKAMPQQVPNTYFEEFSDLIQAKILVEAAGSQSPKIVKISFMRNWMPYAVAAVFIGLVLMAGYFYRSDQSIPSFNNQSFRGSDMAKVLPTITDQEIQVYLNSATAIAEIENTILMSEFVESEDINLTELSEEGLLQYLNEQNQPIIKKSI